MQVKQVYELVNSVTKEVLGKEAVVNEDLSNVVDIGVSIFNSNAFDNYVHTLIDHIGKVIFVNRAYLGFAPNIQMDGWEYGSILEKITAEMPEASETEDWELVDGHSYDPNVFYSPKAVEAKFFNKRITFEIDQSITEKQLKEAFSSATQLNAFVSMIMTKIDNSIVVKLDGLKMRVINNAIACTLKSDFPSADYSAKSGIKAVNLLYLYNTKKGTTLTKDKALTDEAFLRYASYIIGMYPDRLKKMSTLFNVGGKERFTDPDLLHFVLLSNFEKATNAYLYSPTFHNEFVKLPKSESVSCWQGTGTDYSLSEVSKIDVKTPLNDTITLDGIMGVMFDRDSVGVSNVDKRVDTEYVRKGEFVNYFYKYTAGYFNDLNENFVVFFIQ